MIMTYAPVSPRRGLSVLLFVAALHLLAIYGALTPARKPVLRGSGPTMVTAELQLAPSPAPQPAVLAPEPVAEQEPQPVAKPVVSRVPPATGAKGGRAEFAGSGGGGDASGDSAVEGTPGIEVPGTSVEEAIPIKSSAGGAGVGAGKAAPAKPAVLATTTRYQVNPPPTAELHYRGHSQNKGQDIYGSGQINWKTDGKSFRIDGEFNILFLSLLNFRSEGVIDKDVGISPVIYSEKRIRRSETNTHFQHDRNLVSFSSSTQSYQRQGGEQDRASVIWQLAGIGRHDSGKFRDGAEFDLVVAGVRDAEVRHVRVVGLDEIESGLGKVRAWHLVHNRRQGSFDQTLDIWLAPEKEWYPVKLRYTDKSGDFLDLILSDIRPEAAR